jgi:putative membrane protein
MLIDAILAYAHFVFAFLVAGALIAQSYILRLPVSATGLQTLARIDRVYGLAAVLVIVAGVSRVYFGLKPEEFYFSNHAFWAKMAAFALVGLISIQPTMKFLKWNKAARADAGFAPTEAEIKSVRRFVMIEMHVFALVPLFAVLITRPFG